MPSAISKSMPPLTPPVQLPPMPATVQKRVSKIDTKKPPNFFVKLWNRFCEWIKKIWTACFGPKKPSAKLTKQQAKLIEEFKSEPWKHEPSISTKKVNHLTADAGDPGAKQTLAKSPLQPKQEFDPVLEEVRDFIQDFQEVFIDAWSEEFLVPHCTKISSSLENAEKGLKSVLDWVAKLGVKSSKPMFQIVKLTTNPKISDQVDASVENFFKWLLKDEHAMGLKDDLLNKLKQDIQSEIEKEAKSQFELQVPDGQDLTKDYVEPLVEWLVNTNHKEPVLKMFEGKKPNLALIDQTLETLIKLVLERKINKLSEKIHTIFKDKLDVVIRDKLIKANATKFADILSGRLATLIDNVQWSSAVGQILDSVGDHTKAFIAADAAVAKDEKVQLTLQTIQKAKAVEHVAAKPGEEADKAKLLAYLEDIEKRGGENGIVQKALQNKFAEQSTCHPAVKNIIMNYATLSPEQAKQTQVLLEKSQFSALVDNVMNSLFPPMIVTNENGEQKEVDGLEIFWDELVIPQEFYDLQIEAEAIIKEIVSKENYEKMQDLWTNFLPKLGIKQMIVNAAKQKVKEVVTNTVHSMVTELIQPENINELIAAHLIPEITHALLGAFIKGRIVGHNQANLPTFVPMFHLLNSVGNDPQKTQAENLAEKKIARKAIYHLLFKKTYEALDLYKQNFHYEDFKKRAKPHVLTLESLLAESQKQKGEPLTEEEVYSILSTFFTKTEVQHNPKNVELFGELFINFGFKIGGFADEALLQKTIESFAENKLKEKIGKMLDQQVQPFQKSYHMPLHKLVKTARNKLLTEEGKQNIIKKLLIKKPKAKEEDKEIKIAKQKAQIAKISALAHDLIMFNIGENVKNQAWLFGGIAANIAKKTTKWVGIGDDEKQLQKTIEKSIQKILGNPLITENLVFKITSIVNEHLKAANEQVKAKEMTETTQPATQQEIAVA